MTLEAKNLDAPDETRTFDNGEIRLVTIAGATVGRAVFQPGWKWSNDVKPIAVTDSCQAPHTGYVVSGRMHVVMDDGTEADAGPGDAVAISPGHDAWIVGDEPCVMLDWSGAANYANPTS
ncbi:MAG: cupin domain-containing protein [Acidimicrobiales bacterium]